MFPISAVSYTHLGSFLYPRVVIAVAVEDDSLVVFYGFLYHVVQSGLEVIDVYKRQL